MDWDDRMNIRSQILFFKSYRLVLSANDYNSYNFPVFIRYFDYYAKGS